MKFIIVGCERGSVVSILVQLWDMYTEKFGFLSNSIEGKCNYFSRILLVFSTRILIHFVSWSNRNTITIYKNMIFFLS